MSWQDSPKSLNKLTASQQGGNRGAQLWGVDYKGTLYTIYQETPGGKWSSWKGPDWNGANRPKQVYELAACQRHDGCVQLWVLDMKRQLWTTWQNSPGGNWNGWQANWNPPPGNFKFKKIAASQLQNNSGKRSGGQLKWRAANRDPPAGKLQFAEDRSSAVPDNSRPAGGGSHFPCHPFQ